MGDLHVARIKRRLENTTYPHVDVSDLSALSPDHIEQSRLTRALAAFVLTKVGGLSDEEAAQSVTDALSHRGRLWDDTSKSPYKILFNAATNHLRVWRTVQILRAIDRELESARSGLANRTKGYAIHA